MNQRRDTFERIAAALDRLAPETPASPDWESAPAFVWDGSRAVAIKTLDALPLETLRGIDRQKAAFLENIRRLAQGAASHDTLLWGARGMGKSALVRTVIAHVQTEIAGAPGLVQIHGGALASVPSLLRNLAQQSRAYLVYIDDLGFGPDQQREMLALRSLLDGGVVPRPAHIRLVVTSNRRTIVERGRSEEETLHERDARDDALALADRFGLTLGFHPCDRATYLEIVKAYTDPVGIEINEEEALAWSVARGNRSGRTAHQFAIEIAGRAGKSMA